MQPTTVTASGSNKRLWAGRIITAVAVLFLLFDSVTKLMKVAPVMEAFARQGYPLGIARPIGIVLLVCVAVYVIPPTSILGAVLLTGYLGGAFEVNLRAGDPNDTSTRRALVLH